jgi:di/tricarboxylate transporter
MTLPQFFAFAIVAAMMGLFVWGRLRYDLVAMLALLAAIATGIIPPDEAFTGFGDDIVVIVATALLVSAAVSKSGLAERLIAPLTPHLGTVNRQVVVLVGLVVLLSAFVKNVGRGRDPDADYLPTRPQGGDFAVRGAHAAGLRLAARRPHDPDRHLAQRHRRPDARRAAR